MQPGATREGQADGQTDERSVRVFFHVVTLLIDGSERPTERSAGKMGDKGRAAGTVGVSDALAKSSLSVRGPGYPCFSGVS